MTTLLEESHCKHYKRILVGLLRHLGGKVSVPADLFEVGPSEGFEVDKDEEWILKLNDKWIFEEDDCGHEMHENVTFSAGNSGPKLVVVKTTPKKEDD